MITGFSHIGHVVENMDKTLQKYRQLLDLEAALVLKIEPGADKTSLLPIGNNIIMVVEPGVPDGFAGKYIKQNGEGLYCYALISSNLQEDTTSLKQKGVVVTESAPTAELPFRTAWIELHGALIELIGEDMQRWIWQKCQRGKGRARLSHVGHTIRDTKIVEDAYAKLLGLRRLFYLDLKDEGVLSTMLPVTVNYVELIEPTGDGPMRKFLDSRGEGLYHVCLVVKDVEDEIGILKSRGVKIIEMPATAGLPHKTAWFRLNGISYELTSETLQAYLKETGKK
ncbi:MAG: VOC family protein [Smithellaceae bacterium]